MNVEILDCTIRDGGYYCEWDFEDTTVVRLLDGIEKSGIPWVEIGFRSDGRAGFSGKYNFCRDPFLDQLFKGRKLGLAVMIDGKNFIEGSNVRTSLIDSLFCAKEQSRIDLVRITATAKTFPAVLKVASAVSSRGYRTAVNVMQASMLAPADLVEIARRAEDSAVDILCLADSFGALSPAETKSLFEILRSGFSRRLGFHSHDNLGMALANSLAAMEAGAQMIDSSLTGMGRGAGNLRTEQLLIYLHSKLGVEGLNPSPLFDVATNEFAALQHEYGWGPSLPYMLSAVYNVHPMYPQRILQVNRYTPMEVVNTLATIKASGAGTSFNHDTLSKALQQRFHGPEPSEEMVRLEPDAGRLPAAGGDGSVLIVGSGPSTRQRSGDINQFVRAQRPLVLECNFHPQIEESAAHFALFTNFRRLEESLENVAVNRKSILLGIHEIPKRVVEKLAATGLSHYPYEVREGQFQVSEDHCVIPYDVVAMYAFAVAIRSGATRIHLCGFDGYLREIERSGGARWREYSTMEKEMEEFFRLLRSSGAMKEVQVSSLTPTGYEIDQESLYAYV